MNRLTAEGGCPPAWTGLNCPLTRSSVTVTPATTSVDSSKTVQLTAVVRDANGGTLTGRTVTWTSLTPGVATVSASGLVTGVKSGSANVYALSEGKSDTATITVVTPPPPPPPAAVASVTVTPPSVSVETSRTVQLTAVLRDASGNTLTGRAITWTSLNPSVATVSASGLVTGLTVGNASVYALSEGKSDTSAMHSAVLVVRELRTRNGATYLVVQPKGEPAGKYDAEIRYEFAKGKLRLDGSLGSSRLRGEWSRLPGK